ncbi:Protein SMG7 [Fusarium austroafricanum]|uniref:Nonsense-mediated mRNA decay factor n=1 Tax=Fusarium austroafricanum TaxID=2364996 RepID=A0A8H4NYB1_9HYPO|nr:Protein SMG7 [Fusarium austroafricanum]
MESETATTTVQAANPEHADLSSKARHTWRSAVRLRKQLTKHMEKLPKDNNSGVDISQFEAMDTVLDKFRLACVQTIYLDFEYAVAERTDQTMWTVHTTINNEYRRALTRLRHLAQNSDKQKTDKTANEKRTGDKDKVKGERQTIPKQKSDKRNVERRKCGDKYLGFLHVAQEFYKGYVQRLSARYDIPQLKRIAQGIEVDGSSTSDVISPVPNSIYPLVINSCHFTLICLGDLSRYQVQSGLKKSSYRVALAYYSLAHDLKPDSGFPFHQMGMISLEEGKDLDILYYFYRSIATADPHPNVKQNLESKFKGYFQPDKNPSKKQARGPSDAFVTWFTKLHASYYRDETMGGSGELEREVLHRLDMASKNPDHSKVLFKMSLINMASYFIASQKYTEAQTQAASRFCHHTLRINAQFILAFCSALVSELTDIVGRESRHSEDPATAKSSLIIEALLPLLRIYGMWLAARRQEIFAAGKALGTVLPDMMKSISKVFSLLCNETYTQENLASCPYLLSEDIETQGLLPLAPDQVPQACRSYFLESGSLKPRLPSQEKRLSPFQETLARILDILRCAYFLGEDNSCPLTFHVSESGLIFEYEEVPVQIEIVTQPMSIVNSPAREIKSKPKTATRQPNVSENRPMESRPATKDPARQSFVTSIETQPPQEQSLPDDADTTVINMLAPFLRPPTPEQVQPGHGSTDEASYGMHSTTANEVFGMLQAEPSPTSGSMPSGKFEPLPWAWVYTPTPHKDSDVSASFKDAFNAAVSPHFSAHKTSRTVSTFEESLTNSTPQLPAIPTPRAASGTMASPRVSSAAEAAHRNSLLQTFASSSAPRTSVFSQWGQNSNRVPTETAPQSFGHNQAPNGYPTSSTLSAFSHPSSLYQGTPVNGAAFGMSAGAYMDMNRYECNRTQDPAPASSGRRFQMDETTSSYDAAILQAAFYGNK